MKQRFANIKENKFLTLATLLDPRFKTIGFRSPILAKQSRKQLCLQVQHLYSTSSCTMDQLEQGEINSHKPAKKSI